jgi:glycosyltransferase involved in cell wall biosynthesis
VDDDRGAFVIVHATTAHPASDVRIAVRECATLSEAGFRVSLIAQGEPSQHSMASNVVVVPLASRSGRAGRAIKGGFAVLRTVKRMRPDLVHLHDPELIPLLLPLRAFGTVAVYDAHEDLPAQIVSKTWIPRSVRPAATFAARALVRAAGLTADAIVAATPQIASTFPSRKTVVVRNYPRLDTDATATAPSGRDSVAIYVGAVTEDRGSIVLARAAERLPDGCIVVAGPMSESHGAELADEPGWSRISYLGRLDHADVLKIEQTALVGIVTLKPTPAYVQSLPTKLFEYMAAGLAVVASDFGTWSEIVRETDCGVLVDPTDAEAVGAAIAGLLADPVEALRMGDRGRDAAQRKYSWAAEASTLLQMYDRLLARRQSTTTAVVRSP